jgi:hypothetical protein
MASLLSPSIAAGALQQLNDGLGLNGNADSQAHQLWCIVALLSVVAACHMTTLGIKLHRTSKGHDKFWLVKKARRPKGVYIIPHGTHRATHG